ASLAWRCRAVHALAVRPWGVPAPFGRRPVGTRPLLPVARLGPRPVFALRRLSGGGGRFPFRLARTRRPCLPVPLRLLGAPTARLPVALWPFLTLRPRLPFATRPLRRLLSSGALGASRAVATGRGIMFRLAVARLAGNNHGLF